jgi:hypothetical protein
VAIHAVSDSSAGYLFTDVACMMYQDGPAHAAGHREERAFQPALVHGIAAVYVDRRNPRARDRRPFVQSYGGRSGERHCGRPIGFNGGGGQIVGFARFASTLRSLRIIYSCVAASPSAFGSFSRSGSAFMEFF